MTDKKHWVGKFNYNGEVWEGTTWALSEKQAFTRLLSGMAKRYQITQLLLINYFLAQPVRYEIKEIKEEKNV